MSEILSIDELDTLLTKHGIEGTLAMINIEEVEDHPIKIILRTLEHSLECLRAEVDDFLSVL